MKIEVEDFASLMAGWAQEVHDEVVEAGNERIYEKVKGVFAQEQVIAQQVGDQLEISIISTEDPVEFQKKEYGADDRAPAHRLIQLKHKLNKI